MDCLVFMCHGLIGVGGVHQTSAEPLVEIRLFSWPGGQCEFGTLGVEFAEESLPEFVLPILSGAP